MNKNKSIHTTVFLLLSLLMAAGSNMNLKAQNPPNQLALSYGLEYLTRQDLVFSPMVHEAVSGVNLGLSYTRKKKLYQDLELSFSRFTPHLSEAYKFSVHGEAKTAEAHQFNFIDLDYQIGKSWGDENLQFSTGGALLADVQSLNYVYGRIGNFGYYSSIGLGVFGELNYSWNPLNHLGLKLQLPLVSWLARSPYAVNDDEYIENQASHNDFKTFFALLEDGKLATWTKLQYLDLDLSYSHALNQRWSLGAVYAFEFLHSEEPRPLTSFENSLKLQIALKF